MTSGTRIREARKNRGLTQDQLAKKCGLATITIRQYENGKRSPKFEQIRKIARVLGVSIFELLDDESQRIFGSGYDFGQLNSARGNNTVAWILGYTFSNDEIELINNYHALNDLGKVKAREQVEDLTEIVKYQKAPLQDEAQSGEASKEGEGS